MHRMLIFPVLAAAACALPTNDTKAGALDNGQFSYNCIDGTDPACPDAGGLSGQPFPAAVALGGRFTLSYEPWQPRDTPNFTVQAVSNDFFANEGSGFQALRIGTPWFVVLSQIGAVDMASLSVRPISTVQVIDTTRSAATAGRTHVFRAAALGALSEPLAGSVAYQWTTSDANVLAIQNVGGSALPSSTVTVLLGPGTATLTATSSTAAGSLLVTVADAGAP